MHQVPLNPLHSSSNVHWLQDSSHLTLCKEIATAYSENGTNHTNRSYGHNEMSFSAPADDSIASCSPSQMNLCLNRGQNWLLQSKVTVVLT
jgi:hypothetical protein